MEARNIRKTAFILTVILSAALLSSCAAKSAPASTPKPNVAARTPEPNIAGGKSADGAVREIVCWGDSMTEGLGVDVAKIEVGDYRFDASFLSYPEILERLTGIRTCNFGVSGATSEEIAIMQGGLAPAKSLDEYDVIDRDFMEMSKDHLGDVLILEIGSNGGWNGDFNVLIAQYRAMISYSGCDKYIIIGDTDDPDYYMANMELGTSYKDESGVGTGDTRWESALRAAFGEHFINMRAYIIENGLRATGLSATEADLSAAKRGDISAQLRSDWTHFNSYGYYAQALGVYDKGASLGYWK